MPIKLDAFDNKKWTVVVDFYKLNTKILQGYYPLPNIEEILNLLSRARYFSTFDLASGFLQIPVHFEFKKMPIEIRNAPMICQRAIDKTLAGTVGTIRFLHSAHNLKET